MSDEIFRNEPWLDERAGEGSRREIEAMTDRIFGSALARYGWSRDHQGRIEHVGQ